MVGAAFAAVPLYRAFCQATGFDGTVPPRTSRADHGRWRSTVTVRFDTNVRGLPWTFTPDAAQPDAQARRRPSLAFFKVDQHAPTSR